MGALLTPIIPIICMFTMLFLLLRNRRAVTARKIIMKRYMEDNTKMTELAKRFIDKECFIYTFDANYQFRGTIKEVSDGAILVENGGTIEVINLVFIISIREFPKNKKGKKKSVVLDIQ